MLQDYIVFPELEKQLILRNLNQNELKYKICAPDMSASRTVCEGWNLPVTEPNSVTTTHFLISEKKQSNFTVSLMTFLPLAGPHLGETVFLQLFFNINPNMISN